MARWQAEHIAGRLRQLGVEVSIAVITTTGDRTQSEPFVQANTGGSNESYASNSAASIKATFTKEIEEALAEGRIDLAVHSLKDLPMELDSAFALACIPQRADARDAFVSVKFDQFSRLPQGAVVGTSSLRRQALLRALRPDLEVRELRGNVDTRLRKLHEGQYDAVVLAAAGLDRLEQTEWLRERFTPAQMCPAAGQGALAIECRAEDEVVRSAVAPLDDAPTRFAVTVERAALARLEGGCQLPVGAHCRATDGGWQVTGVVASADGSRLVREVMHVQGVGLDPARARAIGVLLAERLLLQGAGELLPSAGSASDAENLRG